MTKTATLSGSIRPDVAANFVRPPAQQIMTYKGRAAAAAVDVNDGFRVRRNRAGAKLKLSDVQIGYLCIALSLPAESVVPGEPQWSIKAVQDFIKDQFGIIIGTKGAWLYMKRCNFLIAAGRTES